MKKINVLHSLVLFLILQVFWLVPAMASESSSTITIDGESVHFSVKPIVEDGTTLVQFRPIFEKLGLSINWNSEKQQITGTRAGLIIVLTIGSEAASINGKIVGLQKVPRIVDGNTIVPLRFVGEASGKKVDWNPTTSAITIEDKGPSVVEQPRNEAQEKPSPAVKPYENTNDKAIIEQDLVQLEQRSAKFREEKDLTRFLSTIDEGNPAYKSNWKKEFSQMTIHTELVSLTLLSFTDTTAKAETVMIYSHTIEIDPVKHTVKEIRDKATSLSVYSKSSDGTWKIAGTEGTPQWESLNQ